MRALIVEHDPYSTPERIADLLESRGIELEPFVVVEDMDDPEISAVFPDLHEHDFVVLMGAPWSAYDPRVQGWVRPEVDFVASHLARGTPLLGVCFGAQIISTSLGGTVTPSQHPEYGWGTVESTMPAISSGPWFQYHGDEFTLPEGATPLAYNESGLQAFSTGHSLAVQFHPEVTAQLIASWCGVGGDKKLLESGIDPEGLIEMTDRLAHATQPALERMIDWWLNDLD